MSETLPAQRVMAKPDHIPDALVYDFDMYHDEQLVEDAPSRLVDIARNAPPIFWTPHNGGHWMVCRYQSVTGAARDWESFSSEHISREEAEAMRAKLPPNAHILQPVPILLDPPDHTRFRAPLNPVFSPKRMMALQDDIRALTVTQIEKVRNRGSCAFMAEVGEPIPVHVFLEMFGLPLERQREFRELVKDHLAEDPGDLEGSQRKLKKIADIMHDTLIDRRDNPRDDLISLLWQSEVDGAPLTLNDLENYCILLFIAGLDTVMNAMGHGIRHLACNPALQEELRADPKLIPEAAEELLRRYSFVISTRRVARDLTYEGVAMKAGERVILYNPAANVDPDEFPQPERFDLHREHKAHVTFGGGPHRCLGSHLARIELQTLYEEMLARLPAFRLDESQPVRYRCGPVIGPREVHIVWDA